MVVHQSKFFLFSRDKTSTGHLETHLTAFNCFSTHVVDPANVGGDPGEDRGLLGVVATHA